MFWIPANSFTRSTHNTRIERLWVEVGSQFARRWRAFFYRLEALHGLDRTNPNHLWLLHRLFLDKINDDCVEFQMQWNSHPISGAGHDQSPDDMFLLGRLENGVYLDDCDGVDPGVISELYGTHGSVIQRAPGETGAGQLDDEDVPGVDGNLELEEEDWEDMIGDVEAANEHHFHHEPVAVPKHQNPFSDDALQIFEDALAEADRVQVIPPGYGLLPEEWENNTYPAFEILKSGRKGSKELRVALPDSIWRPRAESWGRALAVLNHLTYMLEDSESQSESD
ncbi:hypothetical protein C8R47DRAFT_1267661 [Mycena vitilis]|nr:hypothetical protein C8R47DRAFT_974924 [Mycena vitilis]KAJ6494119.1 hypothetical protein C8R47DRAFT_1267661 [Mycena vitilis]